MPLGEIDLGDIATPATIAIRRSVLDHFGITYEERQAACCVTFDPRSNTTRDSAESEGLPLSVLRLTGKASVGHENFLRHSLDAAAQKMINKAGYLDPRGRRSAAKRDKRSTFRQWASIPDYPRDLKEIVVARFIGSEVERTDQRSNILDERL